MPASSSRRSRAILLSIGVVNALAIAGCSDASGGAVTSQAVVFGHLTANPSTGGLPLSVANARVTAGLNRPGGSLPGDTVITGADGLYEVTVTWDGDDAQLVRVRAILPPSKGSTIADAGVTLSPGQRAEVNIHTTY